MGRFLKINRFIGLFLIFSSPLVIGLLIWSAVLQSDGSRLNPQFVSAVASVAWDILGIHFMIWLAALMYFFCMLVFQPSLREVVISGIAGTKVKDEREELIVGHAARASFLSSLALMIFLLLLSGLHIRITEVTPQIPKAEGGKPRGAVSIGYTFAALEKDCLCSGAHEGKPSGESGERVRFQFSGLPVSKSLLIILLLIWQAFSFRLFAHRIEKNCTK